MLNHDYQKHHDEIEGQIEDIESELGALIRENNRAYLL